MLEMVVGQLPAQVNCAGSLNSSPGAGRRIAEHAELKERAFDRVRPACYNLLAFN